jgi:predicted AlkP superfamily pyrophosphatase or phosphodiesterase
MPIPRRTLLLAPALLVMWFAILPLRNQAPAGPRLIVLVVVDQLRADYLTTYGHRWRSGFRTLIEEGAYFPRAEYPYLNTVTCPGHATIATGTFPRTHGIILNRWWHRDERRTWNCTDDETTMPITYGGPSKLGNSAKRLLVPTLADQLRTQKPGARVVTMALKPRSAIMLAGRGGTAVTWLDEDAHAFVTSRAYAPGPVDEVRAFIARDNYERDTGNVWSLQVRDTTYRYPDLDSAERPRAGWTSLFPHPLAGADGADSQFISRWERSPFGDAYLGRMAVSLADAYQLGRRDTTDYLGISFTALDMLAHDFGPQSREVEDLLMRLDETLGTLIEHLDSTVGRDNYLLALTADHGVADIPKQEDAGQIYEDDLEQLVERTLVSQWGVPSAPGAEAANAARYVENVAVGHIYFAPGIFQRLRADAKALQAVEQALLSTRGIARVLHGDRLSDSDVDDDIRAAALGYVRGRSGDLILVTRRNWVIGLRSNNYATSHGTAYEYDRQVPLVFLGGAFKPGRYPMIPSPADIAPTLGEMTDVTMPQAEGGVLRVVIK